MNFTWEIGFHAFFSRIFFSIRLRRSSRRKKFILFSYSTSLCIESNRMEWNESLLYVLCTSAMYVDMWRRANIHSYNITTIEKAKKMKFNLPVDVCRIELKCSYMYACMFVLDCLGISIENFRIGNLEVKLRSSVEERKKVCVYKTKTREKLFFMEKKYAVSVQAFSKVIKYYPLLHCHCTHMLLLLW